MTRTPPSAVRPVLVTGALGNLGRLLLEELAGRGVAVVATDLRTPATERAAAAHPGVHVDWADLRDPAEVRRLVATHRPRALVHLAAIIPPAAYHDPDLTRAVNVTATGHVAEAVAAAAEPCRLVLASSMAVYGSRNPHTTEPGVTAQTPARPCELYGHHKLEAEALVRRVPSHVVLRVAAVVVPDSLLALDPESAHLEALLPVDGRVHVVDGRDVATALAAATDPAVDCEGRTLLVGGDDSCRLRQGQLTEEMTAAVGLRGALPPGLPGDPADEDGWFCVEWMDTTEAQALLGFQHHSWPDMLREARAAVGWKRPLLRAAAPLARLWFSLTPPRRGRRGPWAHVWADVTARWGDGATGR
ncbi:NAD-dependent epimerase/dehydratase family protein [Nocardioides marmoribigeumensis]|uniref:Nucleoside-diphosphate-sugar epimerase n=1 Tax=Nocardioides marmoribigeumensis TaxID=433649 RepID=A0ABU2BYN5_9ACTN|nr:NAD(P)-dependent oxidoreductase [Nocardioides marmoribigeumensis]MDR7363506.1 nucleoside-diphosphate-sugar epimerase [Nocardioides marmoribigeumensis]